MSRKIKICFVIDGIESPTAGTEKQLLLLIENLDKERFDPHLCVLKESRWLREEFALCPLHVVGISSFKSPKSWTQLLRFVRFLKGMTFDIVQTHFRDSTIAGTIAAKLAGVTAIVGTRRNQGFWMNRVEIGIQRFLNRWVTVIIANSENTREWALTTEGLLRNRVRVIYNALDACEFDKYGKACRLELRNELGIPADAPVAGIVANLRPVKGVDIFLRAAGQVATRLTAARFVIIGDGAEKVRLVSLAEELGIAAQVVFLGKRTDVPRLLRILDIGVLASHSESFSNSIVEYLATGLPVVCTDVGGCREAVTDGINGFIVKAGDTKGMAAALLHIMSGNLNESARTQETAKIMQKFALHDIIRAYEELYLNMVEYSDKHDNASH